ncbi:MAG: MarR family winged helix-turn-helix transcriptional regulator [Pseudonocardiaceae bacterium]
MSNGDRYKLIEEIGRGLLRLQRAIDDADGAAAEYLGVNHTDLRCLRLLVTRGPMTVGELAEATRLTPGALTTVVDRLERSGYAQRVRDVADRRRILVELTSRIPELAEDVWGEISGKMANALTQYSTRELMTTKNFVHQAAALHLRHAALTLAKKPPADRCEHEELGGETGVPGCPPVGTQRPSPGQHRRSSRPRRPF